MLVPIRLSRVNTAKHDAKIMDEALLIHSQNFGLRSKDETHVVPF